jgi:cold shock protein
VKFSAQDKEFGFITPDDGDQVFVRISSVSFSNAMKDGVKVRYEVGQDRKNGKSRAESLSVT